MTATVTYLNPDWWDPTGTRHGDLPTYWWRSAPAGLATRRQLRVMGLRPGGQPIAAQLVCRRRGHLQVAYLYRVELAKPKRAASPAQLVALAKAMTVRRTCRSCDTVRPYCIPLSLGECVTCHYPDTPTNLVDPFADPPPVREAA